jgi:hypothetical protein
LENKQKEKKNRLPSDEQRLQNFLESLEEWMPRPTKAEMILIETTPCKWAKILEERNQANASKETR